MQLQQGLLRAALVASLIAAGGGSHPVHAERRATSFAVSAVVAPRCSVNANWPTLSLRCSGHAARAVHTTMTGHHPPALVRFADANRLDVAWSDSPTDSSLLLIEF
jgi:hypothetical protein